MQRHGPHAAHIRAASGTRRPRGRAQRGVCHAAGSWAGRATGGPGANPRKSWQGASATGLCAQCRAHPCGGRPALATFHPGAATKGALLSSARERVQSRCLVSCCLLRQAASRAMSDVCGTTFGVLRERARSAKRRHKTIVKDIIPFKRLSLARRNIADGVTAAKPHNRRLSRTHTSRPRQTLYPATRALATSTTGATVQPRVRGALRTSGSLVPRAQSRAPVNTLGTRDLLLPTFASQRRHQ